MADRDSVLAHSPSCNDYTGCNDDCRRIPREQAVWAAGAWREVDAESRDRQFEAWASLLTYKNAFAAIAGAIGPTDARPEDVQEYAKQALIDALAFSQGKDDPRVHQAEQTLRYHAYNHLTVPAAATNAKAALVELDSVFADGELNQGRALVVTQHRVRAYADQKLSGFVPTAVVAHVAVQAVAHEQSGDEDLARLFADVGWELVPEAQETEEPELSL